MKKLQYIIVPALAGLFFTACNNEPKGPSQAELDTQVEAKVKATQDQLKADCDTRLMQAAQLKADSTLAKLANKKAPAPAKVIAAPTPAAPKKIVKTPTPKTPPPPPAPVNPKADRFNNNSGKKTVTEADSKRKEDRFNGGEKKEVTPQDTKKKADRFGK